MYVCLRTAANLLWKTMKNSECISALLPSLRCFSHSQEVAPLLRVLFFFSFYILYSCFLYVSFIHVCIYVHVCIYTHTFKHTHLPRTQTCACMHIYTRAHTYAHTYVRSVSMYNCVVIYVCVHTRTHTVLCILKRYMLEPFWLPPSTSLVVFPLSFLQSHIAKRRVQQGGCSERRIYGVFALRRWESHLRHPGLSPWLRLENNFWYLIGQNLGYSWPLYLRREFKGKACQVPWEIPKEFWLELHGIC